MATASASNARSTTRVAVYTTGVEVSAKSAIGNNHVGVATVRGVFTKDLNSGVWDGCLSISMRSDETPVVSYMARAVTSDFTQSMRITFGSKDRPLCVICKFTPVPLHEMKADMMACMGGESQMRELCHGSVLFKYNPQEPTESIVAQYTTDAHQEVPDANTTSTPSPVLEEAKCDEEPPDHYDTAMDLNAWMEEPQHAAIGFSNRIFRYADQVLGLPVILSTMGESSMKRPGKVMRHFLLSDTQSACDQSTCPLKASDYTAEDKRAEHMISVPKTTVLRHGAAFFTVLGHETVPYGDVKELWPCTTSCIAGDCSIKVVAQALHQVAHETDEDFLIQCGIYNTSQCSRGVKTHSEYLGVHKTYNATVSWYGAKTMIIGGDACGVTQATRLCNAGFVSHNMGKTHSLCVCVTRCHIFFVSNGCNDSNHTINTRDSAVSYTLSKGAVESVCIPLSVGARTFIVNSGSGLATTTIEISAMLPYDSDLPAPRTKIFLGKRGGGEHSASEASEPRASKKRHVTSEDQGAPCNLPLEPKDAMDSMSGADVADEDPDVMRVNDAISDSRRIIAQLRQPLDEEQPDIDEEEVDAEISQVNQAM